MHRIFVYGTLKRGQCRHAALAGQRFLEEAATEPLYRLYDCGDYPALVESPAGVAVWGELWEVDEPCLARIDVIEGVAEGLYRRQTVQLQDRPPAETYIYLHDVSGLAELGDRF